jgi:hypothetical protein
VISRYHRTPRRSPRRAGRSPRDVRPLLRRRERAHADVVARRIADGDGAEPLAERVEDVALAARRDEHAADRGARLAGLLRLVAHDVGEEQRAGLARELDVGGEDRGIQAIR